MEMENEMLNTLNSYVEIVDDPNCEWCKKPIISDEILIDTSEPICAECLDEAIVDGREVLIHNNNYKILTGFEFIGDAEEIVGSEIYPEQSGIFEYKNNFYILNPSINGWDIIYPSNAEFEPLIHRYIKSRVQNENNRS